MSRLKIFASFCAITQSHIHSKLWLVALCSVTLSSAVLAQNQQGDKLDGSQVTWIDHDKVQPLAGSASREQLRFLPVFVLSAGTCMPSAAFDREGRLGRGLAASGPRNGLCPALDQANIYTRSLTLGEDTIHTYALYFPKDGANPNRVAGHRHDWERVYVWVRGGQVTQVTYGQHAGWYTMPFSKLHQEGGTHPVVYVGRAKHGMYHSRNHGPGGLWEGICYFCDTREEPGIRWLAPHRLLAYESLSNAEQRILRSELWEHANSPFRDDNFAPQLNLMHQGKMCQSFGCQCHPEKGSCPGFP